MIRLSAPLLAVALLLTTACGTPPPVKCQPSNCSGCCNATGECLGFMKQAKAECGSGGAACVACASNQTCSAQGRCVAGSGGGAAGGGEAGGSAGGSAGGGTGGGTVCGGEGEVCCPNQGCNLTLSCSRGLCIRCGQTNQPCCNNSCVGSNVCSNGTCVFPSTGGGSAAGGSAAGGSAAGGSAAGGSAAGGSAAGGSAAGGSAAGGSAAGGSAAGGSAAGGSAAGGSAAGGSAGGSALLSVGDPCILGTECADGLCLTAGFIDGYCSKTCTSDSDCTFGSNCGRNPQGGANVCLKRCTSAGTSAGCRPEYVCDRGNTSLLNVPVCFPKCTAASACGAGAFQCDSRGFCCGSSPYACCENTTCSSGTCSSGYCSGSGSGGGSAGGGSAGGGSAAGGSAGGGSAGGGSAAGGSAGGGSAANPVGAACTSQSQCTGSVNDRRCDPTWTGDPPWPGGYCTIGNCATGTCPSGSSCALYAGSPNHCLANCDFPTQSGCRTGYICERGLTDNFLQGTCYPRCSQNSHCGGTGRCDTATGFCCGNQGFRCCSSGTACMQGTCRSDLGGYCG